MHLPSVWPVALGPFVTYRGNLGVCCKMQGARAAIARGLWEMGAVSNREIIRDKHWACEKFPVTKGRIRLHGNRQLHRHPWSCLILGNCLFRDLLENQQFSLQSVVWRLTALCPTKGSHELVPQKNECVQEEMASHHLSAICRNVNTLACSTEDSSGAVLVCKHWVTRFITASLVHTLLPSL